MHTAVTTETAFSTQQHSPSGWLNAKGPLDNHLCLKQSMIKNVISIVEFKYIYIDKPVDMRTTQEDVEPELYHLS